MRKTQWLMNCLAIAGLLLWGCRRETSTKTTPATDRAPATTSVSTTTASTAPSGPKTFVEWVKRSYPDLPATQPLDTPLDRKDAARIIAHDPIYLDRSQHVWITRPDGDPAEVVLQRLGNDTAHLIRERPGYVHWRFEPGLGRKPGRSIPVLICPSETGNQIAFIEEHRTVSLTAAKRGYRWSDAFSWNDNVVVGHATGASVFERTGKNWIEHPSPDLVDAQSPHAPTQVPVEAAGLIAYVPVEGDHPGSKGAARYVDGQWSLLHDAVRWPGNYLHLIPLADGSVLQIIVDSDGRSRLAFTDFDTTQIDKPQVIRLLEQLDDPELEKRNAAFHQLSTYGTALWPILEAEMPNQPPEVRDRMALLLKNKTDPTLGEMTLVDTLLKVVARGSDGSVLLYSKGGVAVKNVDLDETLAAPAWIDIHPGQPIRLMLGQVWEDLTPSRNRFYSLGDGDWIIWDEDAGPQETIGTFQLAPILRKSELRFSEFVGTDRQGRWYFRERATANAVPSGQTLILDPTLPPVSPRLPVWEFTADGGRVGCDDHDFAAYEDRGKNVWIIGASGFQLMDEKKNHFMSDPSELQRRRALVEKSTTRPRPTTTAGGDVPLLTLADGTKFFGGNKFLKRVAKSGVTEWALPESAQGAARPWLVSDLEGRLFLFNQPGRLIRLRATPGASEPFKIEATFSHKIPTEPPSRVWIDPNGRIIIAHGTNQLAICFPSGIVPPDLAEKIPAGEHDDAD